MPEIKTFQDGTAMGTFSQINFDDGSKILISLTQTEIAIFKVGFLSMTKGILWKENMNEFLDIIYPEGPKSKDANKSVLQISVDLAIQCTTTEEVVEKFSKLSP